MKGKNAACPPDRILISHASVMPNTAASRAKKPFATRWDDDDFDVVVVDPEEVGVAELGTGVPVATAPKPPVTGPLSEICKSLREDDERPWSRGDKGVTHGFFVRTKGLSSG